MSEEALPTNSPEVWSIAWKGEIFDAMESRVRTPSVTAHLKTTVSKLAIAFPGLFMSDEDASKMVQMLKEQRNPEEFLSPEEENKKRGTPMYVEVADDNVAPKKQVLRIPNDQAA